MENIKDDFVEQVDCTLCGIDDTRELFQARDKVFYFDRTEFPAVQCRRCGLVYLNPRPCGPGKAAFYEHEYPFYQDENGCGQLLHHYQPVIDYLNTREPGRLLDIGTGNSPFLPTMKEKGWQVTGTELVENLIDYYREQYDIELFCGELEDAGFEDSSFDAVTIMGVLEHVPNPRLMLDDVARIMKDDGLLALWCFNRGLEARLLGKYWLGFDTPRHIYSFSYDTILRLLDETGFELRGSLFRPISYVSYSAVWAYERVRNWFRGKSERQPTYRLHLPAVLEKISRPFGQTLASRKMSSNMFLFAQKAVSPDEMKTKT